MSSLNSFSLTSILQNLLLTKSDIWYLIECVLTFITFVIKLLYDIKIDANLLALNNFELELKDIVTSYVCLLILIWIFWGKLE